MSANAKEIDELIAAFGKLELTKDLESCLKKATDNLQKLTTLLDENKKAQKNAQDINVAAIFKEELESMNDLVFDSFMDLNKSIEDIINKVFPKENPAVSKFMETAKVKISKVQRELSKTSAKLKEKSIQLEQLDKINQDILPGLISSSQELIGAIKANIAKLENWLKDMHARAKHLEAIVQDETTSSAAQLGSLQDELRRKESEIAALQEQSSRTDKITGDQAQVIKDLKRSIAERDQAVEELTAKITGSEKIIAGLQRDIADKDDRVARLHQAIEEKEAAARDSKTAMERADARAGELKHAIEEKEKILDELKRGLEDSKGLAQKAQALGEMKALCEKQAGEIDTLRDKIVTMNQDLIEKEERYQQVSRSKEMINKELDAARRQCNELQAAIDALSGKNATLKERLAGLEEESNAKARLSEELTRLNDKLRLLEHDSGKVGELQGLLAKQASEIDAWKGKAEILATDLAERNKIIEELQHARQTLENQVKDTIASRTAADKQATDLKDVVEKQAAEIKALTDQIKGLNDSVAAKDTTIESLKQGIAVLKELQSKPRPLESMKEAIKQEADKLKASMAEKHDSELKGKYDALEKEMKHLLKFLEKSPKQQLLFLVSNLGTTSLDKLVEMTRFDEGLVRKILDDLADEKLIHVTPDAAATDPTRLSVKIVEKLNPIGYLDVKHAGLDPDITTRPLEQVLESQLDLVKTFQEFDPETAGYILATLYTRARERQDFASLRQLGAYIGSLKPRSFYLRLVDNLFSTTPGELQSDAASNATGTVPPLIKLDTANAELQENSDGYPKQAPFTVEKVWCISVIEEVERPDINKKARSFNTVTSLINWTWLAAKGGKIKVAIKDGTGRVFDIIVAPGKPRDAELLTKSFKSEAG